MQTLGLDSRPKSDGRLKNLFWPSIQSTSDVDALGVQGFWVCVIIAALTLAQSALRGALSGGAADAVFFFLGGIGVRCRSRFAATALLSVYALGHAILMRNGGQGIGILAILFFALLVSNARATWLAAQWDASEEDLQPVEKPPQRITDWITDRMPALVWPALRWLFYLLTLLEAVFLAILLFHWRLR